MGLWCDLMEDRPPIATVLYPNGAQIQTEILFDYDTCIHTRFGIFYRPEMTWARDPSVIISLPALTHKTIV